MINNFLKLLFKKKQDSTEGLNRSDWMLTVDELFDELKSGKRKEVGSDEIALARAYERSLLPANYRFPQKGDLYRAKFDQTIQYLTDWAAPYSGGGKATVLEGEQFWVESDSFEKNPIAIALIPVKYKEVEERVIPLSDRTAFKYAGYYFEIRTKTINENFDLLQTGFKKERDN